MPDSSQKLCTHCKKEIPLGAKKCPFCQSDLRTWYYRHPILSVLAVLFVMGAVMSAVGDATRGNNPSSSSNSQQTTGDRKSVSIAFAESVIKQVLKSPSTAKFTDVQAYELSNEKDVWAVNGYVDSENSFGASLRSTWEVQLDYSGGKGGTVKSIMFDGKQVQ